MKYLIFLILLSSPALVFAQVIRGMVKTADNEPFPGVTVSEKGQNNITSTNDKGEFQLKLKGAQAVIRFTAAGAEALEVIYKGQNTLDVVIKPRTNALDEVHVIAYGTSTQRTSVGSITKVSGKDLAEQPVTNPLAALEGRVPGMTVVQSSGLPGSSVSIQIRGQNTVNADPSQNIFAPLDQ